MDLLIDYGYPTLTGITSILALYWLYLIITTDRTPKYKYTLVCTPEGYRRILAHCEITKMTKEEYFNRALDLIADEIELVRGDEVKVH